ncbi:MAG: hypothetical protein IT373_20475 [Polyangiaceae bacterium]|nr:hypothetical protein [Polyangiaceae bacterium]
MDTLAELVRKSGRLPTEEAVGWAIRLAKRIEELHRLGVAHGGLSADCVLVAGPSAAGQGFFADVRQSAPRFEYHSPERHQGRGISQADDTWAVAVTLYFAATGALPWPGANAAEVKRKLSAAAAAPLAVYDIDDEELERVFESFLARNMSQRVVRISALREALEKWHDRPGLRELYSLDDLDEGPGETTESGDDEDDEDVKTVMRDFSEVRKQLKQLGVGPAVAAAPKAAAPVAVAPPTPAATAPRHPAAPAAPAPGAPAPRPPAAGAPVPERPGFAPDGSSAGRGPRVAPSAPSPFKSTALGLGLAEAAAAARSAAGGRAGAIGTTMPMPAMPAARPPAPGPGPPAGRPAAPAPAARPAGAPVPAVGPGGTLRPALPQRPPGAPAAPAAAPPRAAAAGPVIHVPATGVGAVAPGLPSLAADDSQDGVSTMLMDQEGHMPAGVADAINRARVEAGLAPVATSHDRATPPPVSPARPPAFGGPPFEPSPREGPAPAHLEAASLGPAPRHTPSGPFVPPPGQPALGPHTPSGQHVAPAPFGPQPSAAQYGPPPPLGPQTPSGQYVPPPLGPQTPSGQYVPPSPGPQTPSGQYVPPSPGPQTPSGQYVPPSPGPQTPSGQYVPPSPGQAPLGPAVQAQLAQPPQQPVVQAPLGAPIPGAVGSPLHTVMGPMARQPEPNPLRRWLIILLVVFALVLAATIVLALRYAGVLAF